MNPTRKGGKLRTSKMAVMKRDTAFNELFIGVIRGLYLDQTITIDEFKDRNAELLKNKWIDMRYGSAGEKIYELLGGLSLHLNHLIGSRVRNYDWPFGTLPFGLFGSNLDTMDLETYPRTYSGHF